jgi:hypothetical protein
MASLRIFDRLLRVLALLPQWSKPSLQWSRRLMRSLYRGAWLGPVGDDAVVFGYRDPAQPGQFPGTQADLMTQDARPDSRISTPIFSSAAQIRQVNNVVPREKTSHTTPPPRALTPVQQYEVDDEPWTDDELFYPGFSAVQRGSLSTRERHNVHGNTARHSRSKDTPVSARSRSRAPDDVISTLVPGFVPDAEYRHLPTPMPRPAVCCELCVTFTSRLHATSADTHEPPQRRVFLRLASHHDTSGIWDKEFGQNQAEHDGYRSSLLLNGPWPKLEIVVRDITGV